MLPFLPLNRSISLTPSHTLLHPPFLLLRILLPCLSPFALTISIAPHRIPHFPARLPPSPPPHSSHPLCPKLPVQILLTVFVVSFAWLAYIIFGSPLQETTTSTAAATVATTIAIHPNSLISTSSFSASSFPPPSSPPPSPPPPPPSPSAFSSLSASLRAMFILLTTANNPNVWLPELNASRLSFLFFASYLALGLFFMNLVLSVIYSSYSSQVRPSFHPFGLLAVSSPLRLSVYPTLPLSFLAPPLLLSFLAPPLPLSFLFFASYLVLRLFFMNLVLSVIYSSYRSQMRPF
ncbi:unnamed protein product [Closterium sp. NIES-53]